LTLHLFLGGLVVYWITSVVRCGEDECIDRPVVAGIASAFWSLSAVVIVLVRGSEASTTAMRWLAAVLWIVTAAVLIYLLPLEVVYN
jgi:hypothetical protein